MITTIFCVLDDFCKEFERENKKYFIEASGVNKRNRSATLSPSEILTILVFFHHSKQRTFKSYYELMIRGFYKSCFGKLVSYNRFLVLAQRYLLLLTLFAYVYRASEDCVFYIDSTVLRVCHNKRIFQHKVFKGVAQRGRSSMGWFYGFKFHYVINTKGEIVCFLITPGNVSDQNHEVVGFLTKNFTGKLFGDKGYMSASLFKKLFKQGIQIITKIRRNMKNILMDFTDKILLRKRGVVESVGNLLKNSMQIEHSRHRSLIGLFINVFAAVIAYNFLENKPSIASKRRAVLSSESQL